MLHVFSSFIASCVTAWTSLPKDFHSNASWPQILETHSRGPLCRLGSFLCNSLLLSVSLLTTAQYPNPDLYSPWSWGITTGRWLESPFVDYGSQNCCKGEPRWFWISICFLVCTWIRESTVPNILSSLIVVSVEVKSGNKFLNYGGGKRLLYISI